MNTTKTIIFFDTETTWIIKDDLWNTLSNWDLIQIAYRKVENWVKTDENLFFNTDTEIEIWAIAIHGIYKKLLIEKSDWKYLNDEQRKILSDVFKQWVSIAHNLDFDIDVLNNSNIELWEWLIDTLKVAKVLWSEWVLVNNNGRTPEYVNLQYLRYFFELYEINDSNWNTETTTAHDAFWDVVVLENVFYKLFKIIKDKLNINDNEVLEIMQEMTKKEFILIETMRLWKYRWKTFEEVAKIDKWYLAWIVWADFTPDIKYTCQVWLWEIKDKKFFGN
jgi:DNA polymerase III epsilon subunit-like protein